MTVEVATKTLDKIKNIRSLDEIVTRGGQAISAYREQRRGGNSLPTEGEFIDLIDRASFGDGPVVAESLWQEFFRNGKQYFFPVFQNKTGSAKAFRGLFGDVAGQHFIDAANKVVDGRIDLLGLTNLSIGTDVDWHREPVSSKRSPLKHWKEFDDLDSGETGNKKIIWELNRHQHFFNLGVAYWMTGDERFVAVFAEHLESWMEQNPPGMGVNWASSLEVSFRAMSWIWSFHFFRNSRHFTPEIFQKALKYLYLHGRHIEQYLSKYYSPNTHLTGEGLGLYYLGTQLPFLDRAAQWRKLGEDILLSEIEKQILPDGVYFEQSTWYQRYTVDMYSHFVLLRSRRPELLLDPAMPKLEERLQKAFDFLMQITLPNGRTPLIGDDDGGRMLPLTTAAPDDFRGSLAVGAAIFDRRDHRKAAGNSAEDLFWLMGPEAVNMHAAGEQNDPETASKEFADGGYCVMRDGPGDTDNYLLVDCGEVGALAGGHGHADALSIEAAVHGRSLFIDSGTYTYHESHELRDYFRSTHAHNTLVVNNEFSSEPGSTFNWKTRAAAKRHEWINEDRFDYFEGSHDGYERLKLPGTHTRSILFLKGDYWIMRDVFKTEGEHRYSLNFHYDPERKPVIAADGTWVGDDGHRLFTFGDNGHWDQKESWISNDHGDRTNAPFMRFKSKGAGTQEFFTFILPADHLSAPPEVCEEPTASGRAFVIKYAGYTDVFVFNDEPGAAIDTGLFETDFRYSWARLSEGETVPEEFVLIDGTQATIAGTQIFDVPLTKYASARRLSNELYVRNDLGRSKKPLSTPR